MKKIYVLDTNILLSNPKSIYGFDDNTVAITATTLQELDKKKTAPGELGFNARETIRFIDSLKADGDYLKGIKLPNKGTFKIISNGVTVDNLPKGYSLDVPDNRIISAVATLAAENKRTSVVLVTNDVSMRVNASICGVKAQGYHNEEITHKDDAYTGRCDVYLTPVMFNEFMKENKLDVTDEVKFYAGDCEVEPIANEYCVVRNSSNPKGTTGLAFYKDDTLTRLMDDTDAPFEVKPRNAGQRFALHALMASPEDIPLVILRGPAGCAKTFLSIAAGLDGAYHQGKNRKGEKYSKVMITRNNVLSDSDLGFLPGTLEEKMGPLVAPFMDNLESLLKSDSEDGMYETKDQIDELFADGIVEICSMAYMRGRSITDSYLIIDEAQNASVGQILEIISRAGKGTKIIVAGDPDQIDAPRLDKINNGLVYAAEKMKGSPLCAQITFEQEECVRSPLAIEAIKRLSK